MLFTTNTRRERPDPDKFPVAQLFLLALLRISEPIALTSLFPYAWKLVVSFEFCSRDDASFYAGVLISAFALSEALTGMFWGALSDRIGRKPVLLLGSAGTCLSLFIVGVAPNYWIALLGRALGGCLNGNIGVLQSAVGEITVNPKHEPRAFSVMPFVWSIGTVIGPAIGGYFSNPAENFPDSISPDGIFARLPYLLPNLMCMMLMLMSMSAGILLLEESHPDMQPWSNERHSEIVEEEAGETTTLIAPRRDSITTMDDEDISYGSIDDPDNPADTNRKTKPSVPVVLDDAPPSIMTTRIMMLTCAFGLFAYHSMTYDHLLPIFFQDDRAGDLVAASSKSLTGFLTGGLGLSTQQVGVIMSTDGLIALLVQGIVFPLAAARLGIYRLFVAVTMAHPIAYLIVPYLVLLPTHLLYPGIYVCLAVRNLLAIIAYPLLLIMIKDASPSPKCLGRINGLAASTGAACRTLASPIAGLLYGVGSQIGFSALAWWASALVALVGAVQVLYISQRKGSKLQRAAQSAVECHIAFSGENEKTFLIMLNDAVDFAPVGPGVDGERHELVV